MRKLAQFSVRYPTTIIMVILAICLLGYIAFSNCFGSSLASIAT